MEDAGLKLDPITDRMEDLSHKVAHEAEDSVKKAEQDVAAAAAMTHAALGEILVQANPATAAEQVVDEFVLGSMEPRNSSDVGS